MVLYGILCGFLWLALRDSKARSPTLFGFLFLALGLLLALPGSNSLWLSKAFLAFLSSLYPGSNLLTRYLLGSLTGSCVAALYKALVAVMHFGGLLRKRGWSQINSMIHNCFVAIKYNSVFL